MVLKIPPMQYDKKIGKKEGEEVLKFAEKYTTAFKDNMAERTLDKAMSSRFLGKGPFEILYKRRINFSDDEVHNPHFSYVQKYKKIITKLVEATTYPLNINDENLTKLKDLQDFFENQGYLTKKQMGLISFLLKDYQRIQSNLPRIKDRVDLILHHHIKKEFMKTESIQELAEILTKKEIKLKEVIPKKKMFFSLSQIRNELSS